MKHISLLIFFIFISGNILAQTGKISGRVIDAKTLEPLPFTNVYINNTTIGVTTDTSGKFTLPNLPLGSAEIVFSFIGYIPQQLKVVVKETGNVPLSILLIADSQQLSEVAIKSGRDKNWEKQLKKFEKVFFGNNANCKILNSWVLDFTEENNMMTAKASVPLEIENDVLGYKFFFQLKKFSFSATEFSIVGNIRFTEMETTDKSVAATWMKNRESAYRASAKFLMKSILDGNMSKHGFVIYKDKLKGSPRSDNFSLEIKHNLLPYDTTGMVARLSGINEFRIGVKEKMEVHNKLDYTKNRFYLDVNNPVSWLETRNGYILTNKEGTILNPTDVAISGSMADGRVSGMLPFDYKPGSIITVQSPESLLAKSLQEKVYLHTDRPYYYPGENIWFSGFMNYSTPGLMDTLSKVLYVDLIAADKKISKNLVIPIDSGRAAGSIQIPSKILPGNYVLRAYTQWMRNYGIDQFFYKPVTILSPAEGIEGIASVPVADNLLKVKFDKTEYKTMSRVKMTFGLDSTILNNLVKGTFSVTVLDEKLTVPATESASIKNDFEMLAVPKVMATEFKYPIEAGISLDGIYQDKKGKPKKAKLTFIPENMGGIFQAVTTNTGEFSLKNMIFYDSTKFVFQPSEGKIIVVNQDTPYLPEKLPVSNLKHKSLATPRVYNSNDTLRANLLKEFKVTGTKIVKPENGYANPDFYIKGQSMGNFGSAAEAIAAKIPGFKLISEDNNWFLIWNRFTITGKDGRPNEPNLYIDNVMVTGETAGNRLFQINPTMIDHVEVNGMISANQGANGSNGLINIFTKKTSEVDSRALSYFSAHGFDRMLPFPQPDYDLFKPDASHTDNRSTLYWNPRVEMTSTHIPVELSFFTSEQTGNFRVIVEGVTNRGNTIHSEAIIHVIE
ncbi:carboxypeptidase-like regulatory domain-containing protein [Dyadobacter subterraneus]|uniref:Carboxypeptidase-like regulatory domain-containing protein n=1 Tax=Dyadobacter subterraneus TaxID=2773304 RepID=A0ABR9WA72_9BACT|nr:carboxypeptidase-like regulatory domain-containing protein [Dyadobacter subterraneus]MBE9462372.1 carboxypeptidase-like regulatory domain-containing protein [Dyadobacter subterraneus]